MKNVIIFIAAILVSVATTAQDTTFQGFLQQFPKATLPFTLGAEELQGQLESHRSRTALETCEPSMGAWGRRDYSVHAISDR